MTMRINRIMAFVAVSAAGTFLSAGAHAATDEQIERLGKDLTCVGAKKAGNEDGMIPEWSGKWLGAPDNVDFKGTGHHPVNPYADEKPLFVITADNMSEHADRLSDGQKALLKKYPDTYEMPVYPSHRDFRFPESVCEVTEKNAKNAKLVDGGEGVEATTGGILFPFPETGLELLWTSSIFTYRPWSEELISDNAYVLENGSINWGRVRSRNLALHLKPGNENATEGPSSYYLNETFLPQRARGEVNTGVEYWNHVQEPRQSWRYDPGTRRVRQAPEYGFDMPYPGSGGSITVDEVRIFNGSPRRYNWKIVGKREMFIPYNTYDIHSDDVSYDELLPPHHVNPDYTRFELHRVWVLEANLKDGYRHLYSKRKMYIDEDTMLMVMGENYDARGNLWKVSMMNYFYAPEAKTWQAGVGLYYDLFEGSYLAFNLVNEQDKSYTLDSGNLSPGMFGPEAARRMGL